MKKLNVLQLYSQRYVGPSQTPNVKKYVYKVTQVVGSTEPNINDFLTKDEVDEYCKDANWSVTIK